MSAARTPPAHVAIIMDGNGRWAQQHLRPRAFGHKAGRVAVDRVVTACAKAGVKTLSLYAFSTENWRRPPHEVKILMELIETALREEAEKMRKNDIRLRVLGDRTALSASLRSAIDDAEALTASGSRMDGTLQADSIDEAAFSAHRPMPDLPPVDLLIRSSGEMRLSNFHLWELAYAELWFTDVLWPDFGEAQLDAAFAAYHHRDRRFGALSQP